MLFTSRILPVPRLCQRTCHSVTWPNSISAGKVYVACASIPFLETGIQKLRVTASTADRSHVGVAPSLQRSKDADWRYASKVLKHRASKQSSTPFGLGWQISCRVPLHSPSDCLGSTTSGTMLSRCEFASRVSVSCQSAPDSGELTSISFSLLTTNGLPIDLLRKESHSSLMSCHEPVFTFARHMSDSQRQVSQENTSATGRPSPDQLLRVKEVLARDLPNFFAKQLDYRIYHQNIVFENKLRNTKTIGLWKYIQQVALLRVIAHLKFAYVKFNVLKITYHPEEGCIKVRWQINGISGLKAMALFWKFKILKYSEMMKEHQSVWLDGFSTFFVNADGLITHHIADKMMPDDSKETVEEVANPFTAKLALYLGLTVPKLGDFTS